jgi:hypothetical protein
MLWSAVDGAEFAAECLLRVDGGGMGTWMVWCCGAYRASTTSTRWKKGVKREEEWRADSRGLLTFVAIL